MQRQRQKQPHSFAGIDRVTPYQSQQQPEQARRESSSSLCDRLSRTRATCQRQLPTDHDYAVSTREYQTDRSSLKSAPTAARPVLGKRPMQRQRQKQPHSFAGVDRVTPYQGHSISDPPHSTRILPLHAAFWISHQLERNVIHGSGTTCACWVVPV